MASKTNALPRESIADRVRETLLDRILSGELQPGTRILEMGVAAELGTSQAPVREALKQLSMLGVVDNEPYRGSRVRAPSKKDIRDAYIVRALLEGLAGTLAAPFFINKTDKLRQLASSIQKAAEAHEVTRYAKWDMLFHREIVTTAENAVLTRSWEALKFESRIQIRLSKGSLDLVEAQKEHWRIIDALDAGDGIRAGQLLQNHVYRFKDFLPIPAVPQESHRQSARE